MPLNESSARARGISTGLSRKRHGHHFFHVILRLSRLLLRKESTLQSLRHTRIWIGLAARMTVIAALLRAQRLQQSKRDSRQFTRRNDNQGEPLALFQNSVATPCSWFMVATKLCGEPSLGFCVRLDCSQWSGGKQSS